MSQPGDPQPPPARPGPTEAAAAQPAARPPPRSPRPDGARRIPSTGSRQTRRRLARAHTHIANTRRDGLHKLTTELATSYDTIVVEHLHVAGMVRNRRLARRIADTGFAELRRQLGYKTAWYGSVLLVADQWYPFVKDLLDLRDSESQAGPLG